MQKKSSRKSEAEDMQDYSAASKFSNVHLEDELSKQGQKTQQSKKSLPMSSVQRKQTELHFSN